MGGLLSKTSSQNPSQKNFGMFFAGFFCLGWLQSACRSRKRFCRELLLRSGKIIEALRSIIGNPSRCAKPLQPPRVPLPGDGSKHSGSGICAAPLLHLFVRLHPPAAKRTKVALQRRGRYETVSVFSNFCEAACDRCLTFLTAPGLLGASFFEKTKKAGTILLYKTDEMWYHW